VLARIRDGGIVAPPTARETIRIGRPRPPSGGEGNCRARIPVGMNVLARPVGIAREGFFSNVCRQQNGIRGRSRRPTRPISCSTSDSPKASESVITIRSAAGISMPLPMRLVAAKRRALPEIRYHCDARSDFVDLDALAPIPLPVRSCRPCRRSC